MNFPFDFLSLAPIGSAAAPKRPKQTLSNYFYSDSLCPPLMLFTNLYQCASSDGSKLINERKDKIGDDER